MNTSPERHSSNRTSPQPPVQGQQPGQAFRGRGCRWLTSVGEGFSSVITGLATLVLAFDLCCACASAKPDAGDKFDPRKFEECKAKAAQGDAPAQNDLGVCYLKGQGVAKDEVEVYKWWFLAAAQGFAPAKQNLALLERELTLEQIAEGKRRADNFKPQKGIQP
ncbi:MAG: hypothetical protein NTW21_27060 [Verrucomicrobia bacterium]|nr:hypothetical protein [Verrucomicrobiota bacterium]